MFKNTNMSILPMSGFPKVDRSLKVKNVYSY